MTPTENYTVRILNQCHKHLETRTYIFNIDYFWFLFGETISDPLEKKRVAGCISSYPEPLQAVTYSMNQ
jgi:hypothetical protein